LSSKMEGWREYFVGLLIHYLKKYQLEGITEPLDVLKCTTEYKCKNDHMAAFVDSHIEKKESAFLGLDEVFNELRDWIKNDNVPIKLPSKGEVEKYICKALNTTVVGAGTKRGFKGLRLQSLGYGAQMDDLEM